MNHRFDAGPGFAVPDGTTVHSIIDPRSTSANGEPWLEEMSTALGVIPANVTSLIHLHPIVTQITWVVSGSLQIKMKDKNASTPYSIDLSEKQSVVTKAGTLFQLINTSKAACEVLYMVSPAFVFDCDATGNVRYNDAIVVKSSWQSLSEDNWQVQHYDVDTIHRQREAAKQRLSSGN